jgi:hypothetical protein
MKKIILSIAFLAASTTIFAQYNPKYEAYIAKYRRLAIREQQIHNIPASITMAQAILESNAGESMLAVKGMNHFGIKCGANWTGKTINKDDDNIQDCFRKYVQAADSYTDHSLFLKRSRYAFLFEYPLNDYKAWAVGLKRAGYATDKDYASKLIKIIEDYQLNSLIYEEYKDEENGETENLTLKYNDKRALSKLLLKQENNDLKCYKLRKDATVEEIAAALGKSSAKMLYYNDLFEDVVLKSGTFVYVGKKAGKVAKRYNRHIVKAGESMHSISQKYGITLKALYKINGITYGAPSLEGQTLFLR